jgi:ABC-type glycerol-3-phosphate transport system substrate-binding protein
VAEYTRPATWEDLKQVVSWLNEAQVEYALVGGYAIAAHGLTRFSEDIDILVNPAEKNSLRWIVALSRMPDGAAKELVGEPDVFADQTRYAIRINDEYTVDVMPSVAGHSWEEMSAYIETVELEGVLLRVLNLEGLLLTKQGLRPKDQMDAAVLQQAINSLKSRKR